MIEHDKYISWKMLAHCPSPEYEIYIYSSRNEIANCLEKAYTSLPLQNAVGLLFLSNLNEIIEFSHKKEWLIENNRIYFPDKASESVDEMLIDDQTGSFKFNGIKSETPNLSFVQQILGYAQELEQIV
ncbi:hypothetical protein MERGE_001652 [Pneumocystis wakefieldiae]|uniref:CSN8/PSMD8/EIF3K domain-containing protein n=1 Tax=Pneumocystis wakefieldiae TaxID=38082 RepID=A0A899FWD5_9ASCO|nr:hypothetical protein MERGE_001652 [Pneumocystis wakefieldiae]